MFPLVRSFLLPLGLFWASIAAAFAAPGPLTLWFTTPGTPGKTQSWQQEALPVGNGRLAAMVYGGVAQEQIQFNEDTIWSGQPHDYTNPNSSLANLALLREDCFNRVPKAKTLADATNGLIGVPIQEAAYTAPGALALSFPQAQFTNYLRTLDLDTATVAVKYESEGITYQREISAGAPSNQVIMIRLTASQPGHIHFKCAFTSPQTATYETTGQDLIMHGTVTAANNPHYGLSNAVVYDARVRIQTTGGSLTTTGDAISVTNADEAILLLGVASNVKNYKELSVDPVTTCSNQVAAAALVGYPRLRQAQLQDYQSLFQRVTLDLGANDRTNLDLGTRKKQMSLDGLDPQLVTLDFQLGRYLLIAGSRPGSQALNLQGKWNDSPNPSWGSKMTLNINEEMNYWAAETVNLPECTLPLFDMMNDLAVTGHRVAAATYGADGWVVHHNTDLWRDAAPCNSLDGIWPTGGAWLCQHVWWHYLYTGDKAWLATNGYPLMKGAALFFDKFLVRHPVYTNWLVTCPSFSPEHDEAIYKVATVPGPTMDNELCRDLFTHVVAASEILGVDNDFRDRMKYLLSQLPPDQIGQGGQLQEWLEDVDASIDTAHRHCSHLVGLYPGDQISLYYTPELAAAAKHSVDLRRDANSALTPWSCAWRMNLRTRLQEGDAAWKNLLFLYGYNKTATNLIFADNNRQLDAIFGRLAGIANFFVQCPREEIILLPALPTALAHGRVSGLRASGAFVINDLTWTNGQFTGATLISQAGHPGKIRSRWPLRILEDGNPLAIVPTIPTLYQFPTRAGATYRLEPMK